MSSCVFLLKETHFLDDVDEEVKLVFAVFFLNILTDFPALVGVKSALLDAVLFKV